MRDVSTAIPRREVPRWTIAWWVAGLAGCAAGVGLPDDRLPTGTSTATIPGAEATLSADANSVRLDGVRLAAVSAVLAGDASALGPLTAALADRAESVQLAASADPSAPAFRGALSLALDRDLPAALLLTLVDAGGQAGFGVPWLVVVGPEGRAGIRLTLPSVAAAGVLAAAPEATRHEAGYANPRVTVLPDRGFVFRARDRVVDPSDGLVLVCPRTPCGDRWPLVELSRLARRVKLDHPRDRAIVVAPARDATIQDVVGALDATRNDALAGRGARELFPDALLGRATP